MSRAVALALAGLVGAALAFLFREPSRPLADGLAWAQWEALTGACVGGFVGFFLGCVSGLQQGSRAHVIKGSLVGLVLGLIAGGLGITMGSVVMNAVGAAPMLGLTGRATGWAVFGMAIGLACGVTEGIVGMSSRRLFAGFMGGLIGGIIGGVLFDVVGTLVGATAAAAQGVGSQEVGTLPRAIGFGVLGLSIGLLIGVVDAATRRAKVRLILGRNEGREWAVEPGGTVLGRSETVHVPLFGDDIVAPSHACIRREAGGYVIYDLQTPIGIAVNGHPCREARLMSGDMFQIGRHTLLFIEGGAGRVARVPDPQAMSFSPVPGGPGQTPVSAPMMPAVGMQTQALGPPSAPALPSWLLVAVTGPLTGQRYPVGSGLELGRDLPAIPLGFDSGVSRRHARVTPTAHGILVEDLGSTNGVLIQGQRQASAQLAAGGTFTLGSTTFRLE